MFNLVKKLNIFRSAGSALIKHSCKSLNSSRLIMDNTREKDIKVIIADRTYKIKVLPEDEDRVVQAAKIIKNRMRELQEAYGAKDKYDYLAMASLLICVELIEKQERSVYENNDIDVRLSQLDELLTDFIRKS